MAAISPATQLLIDKAFQDLQTADAADSSDADAGAALSSAQAAKDATLAASLAAHQQATGSAHDALAGLAKDLGFSLPGG